jgi:preprotein translocase subunit SecG
MSVFLVVMHVVVSIALILIVLLQTGKGADMGAAFGGGSSQTLFGSSGASTFLGKATTVAAVIFMLTSLGLAYLSTQRGGESIMTDQKPPIEQQAAPLAPDKSAQPSPAGPQTAAPAQAEKKPGP